MFVLFRFRHILRVSTCVDRNIALRDAAYLDGLFGDHGQRPEANTV